MLSPDIVKRHFFKFLLSLVRALVIVKRLFVWLMRTIGRFFVWLFNPVILYLVVPAYQIFRRYARRYEELSVNPWERRRIVATSTPSVTIIMGAIIFALTHAAIAASSEPGVIPGSQSILLTRVITAESSDWYVDEQISGSQDGGLLADNTNPPVVYHGGGGVAYVFPYTGAVGRAPTSGADEDTTPVKLTAPVHRYAVQRGDTLSRIASKFSLKIETLLWANGITEKTSLRPGDTMIIPAQNGVIYTIKSGGTLTDVAKLFKVTTKTIATANNISATGTLKKGQILLVPGARPIELAKATTQPPKTVAVNAPNIPQIIPTPDDTPPTGNDNGEGSTPVVIEQPTIPPIIKQPAPGAGVGMVWPTRMHSVTQFFRSSHPGLDIDGDYTDPIYAADDGTVIFSGWNNGGYGNMVLIDHGNGIQTRYGHSSRVFVRVGQEVHKGDVISMVGTTGRSTGTHLHFEVIVNGKHVNPFKYVR